MDLDELLRLLRSGGQQRDKFGVPIPELAAQPDTRPGMVEYTGEAAAARPAPSGRGAFDAMKALAMGLMLEQSKGKAGAAIGQGAKSLYGKIQSRGEEARKQRYAEAGMLPPGQTQALIPAPHVPTDDPNLNAPNSGRVLGVPPSEGGNAAQGGIRGTFDLSKPAEIAEKMAKTGIRPPVRKGAKPKPRGKPDTSPSLSVVIAAPKMTDEYPESGVGPDPPTGGKLERILLEEYGIGGGGSSTAVTPPAPSGRTVLIPDPRNPSGPFIPVPVAGQGEGATPEGLPSSTGAPTRPRKVKPETTNAAEILRLMTPQLSIEQGADRNRYYNAEKQYTHEHGMYHPEEKHKGWGGRILHGLMGAGLGIASQAQPDSRGHYDLGRMLGGGAAAGIWGGVRPAAADQMYNKIMVQPEAERERAKQVAAENVEFEKVRRGTALSGEQQRQLYAERDQLMQEEKQGWEREQVPLMIEQIKEGIKASKANAWRDEQAARRAANLPVLDEKNGYAYWPNGTVTRFDVNNPKQVQEMWEWVRNINAAIGTPEQQAQREGVDEGEINLAMKQRYGEGTVVDLLSIEQAGRAATRAPDGTFTYGPNQKVIDENTYQEAMKRLEKMREEARKLAMQSKEGRIAGSRGGMVGGATQQSQPKAPVNYAPQRPKGSLLGLESLTPYTP